MSCKINPDNSIILTRGDTLIVTIGIFDDTGQPYAPDDGDSVRFALKSAQMTLGKKEFKDATPLIVKQIPMDTLVLQLDPNDTSGLSFGDYVYDVELTHASGVVDTFIANTKFVLAPEVH